MFPYSQPATPAAQNHMAAQYTMLTDFMKKFFDSAQRINELNIEVAKTVMEESLSNVQQISAAKDPVEMLSIAASQAQPTAEKIRAYQQHLTHIAASTQVDLAKSAEAHVPETTRTAAALADEVAKRAVEETEKATQRQKAAMEKLTTPINTPSKPGESRTQAPGRSPLQ
jgi:phasin family protein